MPTELKIRANRENALQSTGPRTVEGKSASSGNALKHGLTAAFRVLPNESQEEFDRVLADYQRTFAPIGEHELFLVEEMVESRWRLARVRRLESALVEQMCTAADSNDADLMLVTALLNNTAGPFKTLQRYAAESTRAYYRALRQLETRRKEEIRNEPNLASDQPATASAGAANGLASRHNHNLHVPREADDSLHQVAAEQGTPVALPGTGQKDLRDPVPAREIH